MSISGESQIKVFPQICKHYEKFDKLELLITLVLKEQYSILYSKFGAGREGGGIYDNWSAGENENSGNVMYRG